MQASPLRPTAQPTIPTPRVNESTRSVSPLSSDENTEDIDDEMLEGKRCIQTCYHVK